MPARQQSGQRCRRKERAQAAFAGVPVPKGNENSPSVPGHRKNPGGSVRHSSCRPPGGPRVQEQVRLLLAAPPQPRSASRRPAGNAPGPEIGIFDPGLAPDEPVQGEPRSGVKCELKIQCLHFRPCGKPRRAVWAHLLLEGLKTTRPHVTQKLTQSTQNVTATLTSAQGDPHPPGTPVRATAVRLSACWGPQRCGSNPAHFPEWHREGPCRTAAPVGHLVGLTGAGSVPQRPLRRPPLPAEGATHTHK